MLYYLKANVYEENTYLVQTQFLFTHFHLEPSESITHVKTTYGG